MPQLRRWLPFVLFYLTLCAHAHAAAPDTSGRAIKPTTYPTPPLSASFGPYKVVVQPDFLLHDFKRKRDLPVTIVYPIATDGPFPIIIFSHAAGGTGVSLSGLLRYWSSHGYICLAPTHPDSVQERKKKGKTTGKLDQDYADAVREVLNDINALEQRVRDLAFLIYSLGEIGLRFPAIKDTMDPRRIGVGGHSLGSYTAMMILGTGIEFNGRMTDFVDPRISCALLLSAQGPGKLGLTDKSWTFLRRPMMIITGSDDLGLGGEDPQWRKQPYLLSPPGDKYFVFIQGANHFSLPGFTITRRQEEKINLDNSRPAIAALTGRTFGETAATQPMTPEEEQHAIFACVRVSSLAFWNMYLKHDPVAISFLKKDGLKDASHGLATIESR